MHDKKYDTLVLSGGSVKGIAFLGAIQYLREMDLLDINTYVGTSIGSMINYLILIGYMPLEIAHALCASSLFKVMSRMDLIGMVMNEGALSFEPIYEELELLTLQKLNFIPTLLELYNLTHKHLVSCTFNATKSRLEYIDYKTDPHLSCLEAVRLSSNIPIIFPIVTKDGDKYIDGGIIMNFPLSYGVQVGGQSVLGMVLNNGLEYREDIKSVFKDILQMIQIPITYIAERQIQQHIEDPHVTVIRLPQKRSGLDFEMNITEVLNMFSNGYNKIKNDLEKHNL